MKVFRMFVLLALLAPASLAGQAGPVPAGAAMTRAQFAAMVSDYFGWIHWSEYNDYAKPVPRQFADVRTGDRYGKQIECALEESIIEPDENQRFHPQQPITRQDAAVILAKAFSIPAAATDALAAYSDAQAVREDARTSVNALAAAGYMKGRTAGQWAPAGTLSPAEATALLKAITAARVAPVQVMPKSGTTSYRRNVNMTTPTPGATIYYTYTDDHTEPPDPTTASKAYDQAKGFLTFDNPMRSSTTDAKVYTLKAVAMKDGMAASGVRTFVYYIVRPQSAAFEARLVHAPTATSPAVWDVINPSDYNRPHVYYIEGSLRGVVMDAGQYPAAKANLKTFIDTLATKPYDVVLGHNNPDHVEQIDAFVQGGVRLYMTPQDKGSVLASKRPDFIHAAEASVPIHDGDVLDLGNVQMTAYQAPGHSNGQVILQDKKNGWIFGSDMFGCNRPATADITNYGGVKMDLFLSLVQQLYTNLRRGGGRIVEVYNAHNEVPVGYPGIWNFEQAVQQLIDRGDAASVPSMRGMTPGGQAMTAPLRMSMVGDMWRDKNWIALWVGGVYGGPITYLTKPTSEYACRSTVDYTVPDGYRKYSVLSNLEIGGGELAGVDVTWAPPSNGVPNTLPNKFDPWTYEYDVKVPRGRTTISVTPTAMSNRVTSMKLNGAAIKPGTAHMLAVSDGTAFTIDVVAPDGTTASHYVFTCKAA